MKPKQQARKSAWKTPKNPLLILGILLTFLTISLSITLLIKPPKKAVIKKNPPTFTTPQGQILQATTHFENPKNIKNIIKIQLELVDNPETQKLLKSLRKYTKTKKPTIWPWKNNQKSKKVILTFQKTQWKNSKTPQLNPIPILSSTNPNQKLAKNSLASISFEPKIIASSTHQKLVLIPTSIKIHTLQPPHTPEQTKTGNP